MISHNFAEIRGLLVDFDGTLVDFEKSQKSAFKLIMNDHDIFGRDVQRMAEKFLEFDLEMWSLFEKGGLTIKEVQMTRFQKLIDYFPELTADAWEINQKYLIYLINETDYYEGVLESLTALRKIGIKIVIISNGVDWTQKERLKKLDLFPLIDGLLTSEGVGFSKPHPAMFEEGMKILKMLKSNVWVVGDNPNADIKGAKNVGIASCLISNGREFNDIESDMVTESFSKFASMVIKEKEKEKEKYR
ncbi:MAG: HAD family hydrolase [Candidatus Hodarchaeales archaeon]|jgi:YjjG family noncanonical pyrimidine nucleotidase